MEKPSSHQQPQSLTPYFPVKPYPIQQEISHKIYQALHQQQTKILIIQSPTGTGKTFSLLVPTLVWLKQNRFKLKEKTNTKNQPTNTKIPSFLIKKSNLQSTQQTQNDLKKQKQSLIDTLINFNHIQKLKSQKTIQQKKTASQVSIFQDLDVDEIDKQADEGQLMHKRRISKQSVFLQRQTKVNSSNVPVKLIFISRAHTQLAQATKAAQKVIAQLEDKNDEQIFTLTLGSKNLLCCNNQIKRLASEQDCSIEEKCQFLLNKSSCPHVTNHKIKQFFCQNIQEASKLSQQFQICGYYSLKNLIQCTDVIFVPYSSIVDKQIRQRIGININNSIIVFDQGHNLLDFIKDSRSCQISHSQVKSFSLKSSLYLGNHSLKFRKLWTEDENPKQEDS